MSEEMHDLRLAFGALRATPIATTAAILSLGLRIGADTTLFSLVNAGDSRPDRAVIVRSQSQRSRSITRRPSPRTHTGHDRRCRLRAVVPALASFCRKTDENGTIPTTRSVRPRPLYRSEAERRRDSGLSGSRDKS
jgi:hypothetical protein